MNQYDNWTEDEILSTIYLTTNYILKYEHPMNALTEILEIYQKEYPYTDDPVIFIANLFKKNEEDVRNIIRLIDSIEHNETKGVPKNADVKIYNEYTEYMENKDWCDKLGLECVKKQYYNRSHSTFRIVIQLTSGIKIIRDYHTYVDANNAINKIKTGINKPNNGPITLYNENRELFGHINPANIDIVYLKPIKISEKMKEESFGQYCVI